MWYLQGLVSPSRRFVESSLVLVWNNNMKPDQAERRVIFLFNDLIVEAKPSKKVHPPVRHKRGESSTLTCPPNLK
jgi:hypothetical protein